MARCFAPQVSRAQLHRGLTLMIRDLRASDSDRLFSIFERAQSASLVPIGPRWTRDQFAEECQAGGVTFVDAADRPTAFILFRDLGEALEIEMLATHPDFLRQGQMRALLDEVFRRTRKDETRLKAVWLEVHELNALARQLYEKMGFKIVGKRPRYYSDGGAAILYNYG